MVKIFCYQKNRRITNKKKSEFLSVLSAEEVAGIKKFKFQVDRETALVSRYMARKLLAAQFNLRPGEIKLRLSKFGRPVLNNPRVDNFDFNVSHSGDWIIVALGEGRVGIDIEEIKPINLAIAFNYFCRPEIEYIQQRKGYEINNFYKIWTLKESFIKAVGNGLSYPLKDFYFSITADNKIEINIRKRQKDYSNEWHFQFPEIDPGYKMAICTSLNQAAELTLLEV